MIDNLDDMYPHFRSMAGVVDDMTGRVGSMRTRVADISLIAADMQAVNGDTAEMRTAVDGMTDKVSTMAADMGHSAVPQMACRCLEWMA